MRGGHHVGTVEIPVHVAGVDAEGEDAMSVVRLKESNIGDEKTAVGRYMIHGDWEELQKSIADPKL